MTMTTSLPPPGEPRQLNLPCLADGCPGLVGLTDRGDGAWRGECWTCGMGWSLNGRGDAGSAARRRTPALDGVPPGSEILAGTPWVEMPFGPLLNRERVRSGRSQGDVARLAGIDRTTVTHYEAGDRDPEWPILVRLCRVLPGLATALAGADSGAEPECPPASSVPRLRERLAATARNQAARAAERAGAV